MDIPKHTPWSALRLESENGGGGTNVIYPGFLNAFLLFTACESLLSGDMG